MTGRNGRRYDIQFKGSGRTRFSRGGDGRAALGPMLREYVISEAMAALGIPTTRRLAVVTTGEPVLPRDASARGDPDPRGRQPHPRRDVPVLCGAAGRTQPRVLADYAIDRHYPGAARQPRKYLAFFRQSSTARPR